MSIALILSPDDAERVITALKLMRELDDEHGYRAEVEKSDVLIERLRESITARE